MKRAVLVLLATLCPVAASGQERRLEVGAQLAVLRLVDPITTVQPSTQAGVAGVVSYAWHPLIGLDATLAVFPSGKDDSLGGGRKVEGLAGVKIGTRADRFGAFGKVRPGFVRYGLGTFAPGRVCIAIFPPPPSCLAGESRLAVDVGGVFEFRVSPAVNIRVDVGDTIVRRPSDSSYSHNVQVNTGVMFRVR